jgi:predicted nucleic acid-binding protein
MRRTRRRVHGHVVHRRASPAMKLFFRVLLTCLRTQLRKEPYDLVLVYEELVKGGDRPGAEEVRRGAGMQQHTLRNRQALAHLPRGLAQGDCEAMLLAEAEGATRCIDERKAREGAAQRGLAGVGRLWGLKAAQHRGMILAVRPILAARLALGYGFQPEGVIRPCLQAMAARPPPPAPPQA